MNAVHPPLIRALLCASTIALAACGDRAGSAADSAAGASAAAATAAPAPAATVDSAPATVNSTGAMLDPNSATREQLTAMAGMTPAAADALIAGRPHADMLAVDRALSSIGAAERKALYAALWKPIDLNKATKEEILLIPGVGPKMQHEFEEYRPYTSIEQFRREMGKYVDAAEVARLEKYVSIR